MIITVNNYIFVRTIKKRFFNKIKTISILIWAFFSKTAMHWFLHVSDGTNNHVLKAELLFINHQIEQIKLTGEGVSIVLESNRPLLREIELKKPVTWKIVKGKLSNSKALERIIQIMEACDEY